MLSSAPISVFLGTTDADKARIFYEDMLGLTCTDDNDYALVFALGAGELRLSKLQSFTPQPWTVLDFQVEDLRVGVRHLDSHGIAIARFDGIDHDMDGIWTAEDGTMIAWFRDPDGNVLSISQRA